MTKRLLLLNGIAALLVVLNHSASYGFQALFFWTNRYREVTVPNFDQIGSLSYYALFLIHQLAEFAIPAFLFVSGFFVAFAAKASSTGLTWGAVLSRIKKLILPFLIWSIILAVVLRLPGFPPGYRDAVRVLRIHYYIPLIIQFYLLSPLLIPLAKNHWKLLLVVTAVIQLGVEALRLLYLMEMDFPGLSTLLAITPVWFFPGRIFYFTVGMVTSLHVEEFGRALYRLRWALLAGVIFLLALSLVEYEFLSGYLEREWLVPEFAGISKALFASTLVLCFLAFDRVRYPYADQISKVGGKSLGIYLMNTPAIYIVATLMYYFTPRILGHQILYQPILIAFGLGVPLLLMSITITSPARKVYHYVFG
jgi:fucose 4-O-acetylase-like acetyltransferase